MHGAEFKWLVSLASATGRSRVRLAHQGLLTLALALAFLAGVLASPTPALTHVAAAAAPAAVKVDADAGSDWSRTFVRFWILVPLLLPHDN